MLFPLLTSSTWLADPSTVFNNITSALEIGYRHIDCAPRYANEDVIGNAFADAFKKGVVKRDDLFIASKVWPQDYTMIRESCEKTLKDLQVDHLDQILGHFPAEIHKDCKTFFPENNIDLVGYNPERLQVDTKFLL